MSAAPPSMLTPVEVCPVVNLAIPAKDKKKECDENNAYLKFADKVQSNAGKAALNIGIAVDKNLINIFDSVSQLTINGIALTAAYTSLLIAFPDLDEKIQLYTRLAEEGWDKAQNKKNHDAFTTGYVNYILPTSEQELEWIKQGKELEKKYENSNILVRAAVKGKYATQSLLPTKETVQGEIVRGTAKALNMASNVTAAAVRGTSTVLGNFLYYASEGNIATQEDDEPTEDKLERVGGYIDTLSTIGTFFKVRHEYFNSKIPVYLQWLGPFAPYAVLASLGSAVGLSPAIVTAGLPLISAAAAWTIKGAQATSDLKSKAAIDSVKFVLLKLYEVLKETKIPANQYSDLIARTIVAISCPAYSVRESDEKLFTNVDQQNVVPLLYFLRYAQLAYCVDPDQIAPKDIGACNTLNRDFSRRYYRIMDNVKGVEGFNKSLINFFIVYDLTLAAFVVSFQGTTTLDDILLDAYGKAEPYEYTDRTAKQSDKIQGFCHKAMLQVARNCTKLILEKLAKDHPFYLRVPIITTGHSLGAGVASIAALLLREKGVYAYCIGIATPACMSPNLAEACATYVASVINNADIVPRLSECALFNLTSSDRVCNTSDIKKLITAGNVFWMREVENGTNQEMVQLNANNPFATSILARIDCLTRHATKSYEDSLRAVNPDADADAIDFDFSLLLPSLPERKLEPEFLILYLPDNVAKAIKSCINRREFAKVQRSEKRKEVVVLPDDIKRLRQEVVDTRNEMLAQYNLIVEEKRALEKRIKELTK